MRVLLSLFFALALPTAPTGFGIADAALVQKIPKCALGDGYPYWSGDVIGVNSGCPGAAHFAAEAAGYAVKAEDGDLAGTLVSFADVTADGSAAIHIPTGSQGIFPHGQARFRTPALGAGTFTLWARTRGGGGNLWESSSVMLIIPSPAAALITTVPASGTYQWTKLSTTVSGGAARDVFLTADPGIDIDCLYLDVSANAIPVCPGGTVPPAPQYVVLDTAILPSGVADAIWTTNVNLVPWHGSDTGMVSNPVVKVLWNSASNKVCVYQEQTSAGLLFATTGDDDTAIYQDSAVLMDWRNNSVPAADTNTYRWVINGNASPALLDGNYPAGAFSSTFDLSTVTRDRSYAGGVLKIMECAVAPSTIVSGTATLTNYSSIENVSGKVNTKRAAGTSFVPSPLTNYAVSLLTLWSATQANPPPDTTAPTIGLPVVLASTDNSQTWRFTCTDAGSGCASATLDYDSNSGLPYTYRVVAPVSGANPDYIVQVVISGLTPNTTYFVRGCATDGAGNTACSAEANAATLPVASTALYFSSLGQGTRASTGCINGTVTELCPFFELSTLVAGDTGIIKNGTHNISTPITVDCNQGAHSGALGNPITVRSETERQAHIHGTGGTPLFVMTGCNYWTVDSIRWSGVRSSPPPSGVDYLFINNTTGFIFRKNIIHDTNNEGSTENNNGITVGHSTGALVEENECYNMARHCITLYHTDSSEGRRNYRNPGTITGIDFGYTITSYPGSFNLLENNICENCTAVSNESAYGPHGVNNKFLGNIAFTNTGQAIAAAYQVCRAATDGLRPTGSVFKDNVTKGSTNSWGVFVDGAVNTTVDNNSGWGSGLRFADNDDATCTTGGGPASMTGQNNLMVDGSTGFAMTGTTWTLNKPNAFGNATNYSPASSDGRYTSPQTLNPSAAQRNCPLYIVDPQLKSQGVGGADIGANVLYQYVNGTLTSTPLWDFTQTGANRGQWITRGATVKGVNDSNGLIDVHQRLGFGNGGCASPSQNTITVTNPATNPYITTASTLTISGSAVCSGTITPPTWVNDQGGSGTATGTTSWAISNAKLITNANNQFTITNHCSTGNSSTVLQVVQQTGTGAIVQFGLNEGTGTTITDSSGLGNNGTYNP